MGISIAAYCCQGLELIYGTLVSIPAGVEMGILSCHLGVGNWFSGHSQGSRNRESAHTARFQPISASWIEIAHWALTNEGLTHIPRRSTMSDAQDRADSYF